jgi:hypothetical protein
MTLAHIAGVPVEESLQPLAIAFLLSSAWLTTRLRRPRDRVRGRSESANDRHRYASRAR